jgi:hypothetical protein
MQKWWKKNGYDFSKPAQATRFMVKSQKCGGNLLMSKSCGSHCYTGGDLSSHVPIKFHAEVVLVSSGSSLVPPGGWDGNPWGEPVPTHATLMQRVSKRNMAVSQEGSRIVIACAHKTYGACEIEIRRHDGARISRLSRDISGNEAAGISITAGRLMGKAASGTYIAIVKTADVQFLDNFVYTANR